VRLVNGAVSPVNLSPVGRLEIYLRGQWGTVCSDGFSRTNAEVVCGQLGYVGVNSFGTPTTLG